MTTLILIAALDQGGVIGDRGSIPWRSPEDMRYFRETTTGHAVIMGRRTFESLKRPLKDRLNIVLTREPGYRAPQGVVVAGTPETALAQAGGGVVYVAGGGEIYALYLPRADRLYLTRIAASHTGDTRFPTIPWSEWRLYWVREGEGCRFERYERVGRGEAR